MNCLPGFKNKTKQKAGHRCDMGHSLHRILQGPWHTVSHRHWKHHIYTQNLPTGWQDLNLELQCPIYMITAEWWAQFICLCYKFRGFSTQGSSVKQIQVWVYSTRLLLRCRLIQTRFPQISVDLVVLLNWALGRDFKIPKGFEQPWYSCMRTASG